MIFTGCKIMKSLNSFPWMPWPFNYKGGDEIACSEQFHIRLTVIPITHELFLA